jgi:hypothetical protein
MPLNSMEDRGETPMARREALALAEHIYKSSSIWASELPSTLTQKLESAALNGLSNVVRLHFGNGAPDSDLDRTSALRSLGELQALLELAKGLASSDGVREGLSQTGNRAGALLEYLERAAEKGGPSAGQADEEELLLRQREEARRRHREMMEELRAKNSPNPPLP